MQKENQKIRLFGYGTLINQKSLRKTIPNAKNIFPARLKGFKRIFNIHENRKLTRKNGGDIAVLNLEKINSEECINGVCFDMDLKDIEVLQEREKQYHLIPVEVSEYKEGKNKFKAYVWIGKDYDIFDYDFNSDAQKEYLKICLDGCKDFGLDFKNEFKKTTYIGKKTIFELESKNIL